jgi:hypothetical protein
MCTQQKLITAPLHDALMRKLHPDRFPRISGLMTAVVAFVLDTTFVHPRILEINVTRGLVFARAEGELSPKHLIGAYADFLYKWLSLISAAGLTGMNLWRCKLCSPPRLVSFLVKP